MEPDGISEVLQLWVLPDFKRRVYNRSIKSSIKI